MQAVGRKLGMYMRRRLKVRQEGERRNIFLRYLGEVASAVSEIRGIDRQNLFDQLVVVARKRTAEADAKFDDRGRRVEPTASEFGENVLIVKRDDPLAGLNSAAVPKKLRKAAAAIQDSDEDDLDLESADDTDDDESDES